jgi:hypothetical protein
MMYNKTVLDAALNQANSAPLMAAPTLRIILIVDFVIHLISSVEFGLPRLVGINSQRIMSYGLDGLGPAVKYW